MCGATWVSRKTPCSVEQAFVPQEDEQTLCDPIDMRRPEYAKPQRQKWATGGQGLKKEGRGLSADSQSFDLGGKRWW